MPRALPRRLSPVFLALLLPTLACGETTPAPSGALTADGARANADGKSATKPGAKEGSPQPGSPSGTSTASPQSPQGGGPAPTTPPSTDDPPPVAAGAHAYDGQGFVVHEWGTNTVVAGSDGSIQRGLHHEEEDLPAFVYDRVSAGRLDGSKSVLAVDVKMETPVTYFYSSAPRTVKASVGFPAGILTEWYPAAQSFYPLVFQKTELDGQRTIQDPVLDAGHVFGNPSCREQYGKIGNGLLDWGEIEILAPGAPIAPPAASRDAFTWEYARDVQANPLRVGPRPGVASSQVEKFLFYRGLGNFGLSLRTTAAPGGVVALTNTSKTNYAVPAFYVNVEGEHGSFRRYDGVAPGEVRTFSLGAEDRQPLASYRTALGEAVKAALVEQGLFDDEAAAMVSTWSRQWFRTPGRRVLYLLPQAETELQIPLTVTPKPDTMVRVMMMRVEIITPELEEIDVAALADPAAKREQHFVDLGRFGEPRLRRAITLAGDVDADVTALLAKISAADTHTALGE